MDGMYLLSQGFLTAVFCVSFALIFGLRGRMLPYTALGGVLGILTFRILEPYSTTLVSNFVAALVYALYAEGMARRLRKPASLFLIIAMLPLVPGAGIYKAIYALVEGNGDEAARFGTEALGIAAILSLAMVLVNSAARFSHEVRARRLGKR